MKNVSTFSKSAFSKSILSKSTLSKSVLALTTALMLSTSATAFDGGHGKHKHKFENMTQEQREAMHEKRLKRMAKKLNLTDAQVTQIRSIHEQNKEQKQNLHRQKKQLREKLRSQHQNNDADTNIEATHDEMYELKKKLRQIHRDQKRQVESILTPEQLARAKEIHSKRMKKFEKQRGNKNR